MKRKKHGTKAFFIFLSIIIWLVSVPAFAQTAPTLDGFLDDVYLSHGTSIDYAGFYPQARAVLYFIDNTAIDADYIYIAWVITTDFNDNSYDTNMHSSWPGGHEFFDLYESDKQRLDIENSCGETVFDATMDLLDESATYTTPSGYDAEFNTTEDSEQIYINPYSGADWSEDYVDYSTSLAGNLNELGYCVGGDCSQFPGNPDGVDITATSPPWLDEPTYTPVAIYGDWEYHLIWEIRLHRDVFITAACPGGGILGIATNPVELHASPSKIGVSPVTLFKVVSSVGDYIWLDANRDGIQDVTENGIGNVTVDIYNDANENGVVDAGDGYLYTTTTDSYGRYLFRNLGTGKYVVEVTDTNNILGGLSLTTGTAPYHGTIDLGADSRYLDADFGYAPAAGVGAIGDYVWSDADNDGIQDPGEPGIGGVTINLLADNDGDGNFTDVVATATTRDDGSYLFTGLDPDYYVVDVTDTGSVLTGYTLTVGPQSRTDPSDVIELEAGEVYLNADFGYYQAGLGTIGNQIWFEDDGDGLYEPANGETGIAEVTVDLYKDTNSNGVWDVEDFVISSITATDGTYQFSGLSLDDGDGDGDFDYFVHVSDTHDVLGRYRTSTGATPGADNNSQADPYHVELSAASPDNTTADFGYWFDKVEGMVGDFVWYDLDGDGVQDDGEPGIAGVKVELWTLTNKGALNVKQGEITTDANGKYYFPNLPTQKQGIEYAIVVHADNFLAGGSLYGFTATNQPDHQDESVGLTDTVTEDLTLDFGYRKDPTGGTYSIGDLIWLDRDGDGTPDVDEIGFENVTIDLYDDLNGNGVIDAGEPVIATDITDASGNYLFSGLPDGDYIVQITDDFGILNGYTKTAGTDNWPVNINGAGNLNIDYGFTRDDPTLAFVAPFHAYGSGGRAVVHWETTAENGTVGFNLLRQVKETGQYRRVNNRMLPGLQNSIRGGIYRFVDDQAQPGGSYTYILEEIEAAGSKRVHGPFEVTVGLKGFDYHTRPELKPLRGNYSAQPHPVPEARKARLRTRAMAVNAAKLQKKARAGTALKIAVKEKGFYFVAAAAVAQTFGIPQNKVEIGIRNRSLLLTNRGQEVTYIPAPGNSGLYFYGEDIDSIYTNENIYRLTKGKGAGLEYGDGGLPAPGNSDDTFIDTLHIEKDKYALTAIYSDPEADYWLWDFVYGGQSGKTFDFVSPGAAGYGMALLRMNLKGATDTPAMVDHHVKVSLNGTYIGEGQWDGIDSHSLDIYFEPSLLYEAGNTLEVSAVLNSGVPYSVVHIDSFDLSYRRLYRAVDDRLLCRGGENPVITVEGFSSPNIRVFDVTDPKRPKMITGISIDAANRVSFIPAGPKNLYYVLSLNGLYNPISVNADKPSYLKKRRNRAEYVVIAPAGLEAAAKNLADLRQNRGLETMVVELEDIYDEFNYGIATPAAIKDFLAYAYRKWNGSGLKYVVLAGEGTYDYKNNSGNGGCLVPPLMAATPYGLFGADNRFGDAVGNDGIPEIAVGRLPVLTGAELQSYVDKMTDYEGSAGAWTGNVMMLADDPDEGGDFPVDSDYLATIFPLYNVDKVYLPYYSTIDEARRQVLNGFDEGALLINYIGHSGLNRLAKEGLLLTSDVAALQNGDRLPLLTAFTCLVGRYEIPNYDSLSEELVLKNNGGAAAVWAPTGASLNPQARKLAAELFKALFQGQDRVLGNAVVKAMQKYAVTFDSEPFMLAIYNLLGDPALEIK